MLLAVALVAAACSGGDPEPTATSPQPTATTAPEPPTPTPPRAVPTPTPTPAPVTGSLDVRVTDAPDPSITEILITASNIEVHPATASDDSTWFSVLEGEHQFDLLKVVGQEQYLGVGELPPGRYTQIRLTIQEVLITKDGTQAPATVPSGVLRIVRPFEVVLGESTIITLDFDADRSVVSAGPRLLFKPTVKLLVRKGEEAFVPELAPTPTPTPTAAPTPTPTPTPTQLPAEFVLHIVDPPDAEAISSVTPVRVFYPI